MKAKDKEFLIAKAILSAPVGITFEAGKPLPGNIQFMPPGRQKVTPYITKPDGTTEAGDMEIIVSAKYAEIFDDALQQLLAKARSGKGDKPFTDFNHEDAGASSRPVRFFWGGDDPVAGGVRLETVWTASGKSAVEGGDYSRFSPQWCFHKKTLEPLGLPVNVGGLVNRAAFSNIAPIMSAGAGEMEFAIAKAAAADIDPDHDGDDDSQDPEELSSLAHKASSRAHTSADGFNAHSGAYQAHKKAAEAHGDAGNKSVAKMHDTMAEHHKKMANDYAEQALAASSGAVSKPAATHKTKENMTEQEIATAMAKAFGNPDVATAITKVVETATKPLADKIASFELKEKEQASARAKSAVLVHIERGAIAPEDTNTIKVFEDMYLANATAAETVMGKLPGKKPQRIITTPGGAATRTGNTAVDPEERIMAAAKDLRKNNPTLYKTDAAAVEAYMRTAEGMAAYNELREDVVTGAARLAKQEVVIGRK